jgi:hypothetical protein
MDYFKRDMAAIIPDNTSFYLKGTYTLKKSLLPQLLKTHGYELINFSLCDIEDLPARSTPLFEQYEEKAFYLATFWGRLQRDLSLNSSPEKFAVNTDHIKRNRDNYSNFMQELRKESSQPRFVFGHVLLPHRPAYLDRHGRVRPVTMSDFNDRNHDSLYLEQLIYANTLIDSLAQAANQKRSRPLVLIIEGDHGNRYAEWGRHIREKQFMNLNTYYFSDKDYSALYDNISPVNSFRVVFNKYFGSNLPLLKDSTVLIE